jgi:sulfur-oxidizing protein SoxZ
MSQPSIIRATETGGVATVRVRMSHVMESGTRRNPAGQILPAHYITQVEAIHNGRPVLTSRFSGAVSANPFMAFRFKGAAKGDKVVLRWVDTQGATRSDEATIG